MRSPDVDDLLSQRSHPLAAAIAVIRSELLAVPDVIEDVKWNAPNYALADDFATLQLRRDDVVQVILHTGAKVKPDHPEIVLDPVPSFARRAGRNRFVLSFFAATLSDDDIADLSGAVRSWTTQLV